MPAANVAHHRRQLANAVGRGCRYRVPAGERRGSSLKSFVHPASRPRASVVQGSPSSQSRFVRQSATETPAATTVAAIALPSASATVLSRRATSLDEPSSAPGRTVNGIRATLTTPVGRSRLPIWNAAIRPAHAGVTADVDAVGAERHGDGPDQQLGLEPRCRRQRGGRHDEPDDGLRRLCVTGSGGRRRARAVSARRPAIDASLRIRVALTRRSRMYDRGQHGTVRPASPSR